MTRTPLPPRAEWAALDDETEAGRRVRAVLDLERAGAAVHLLQADTGDFASLQRAIRAYENEAWPEIGGVVHAAGVVDARLVGDLDADTFHKVVQPKLAGAVHLDRLFPDAEVFLLFSSISAWLGPPGMANYASANAGLDAIAYDRRARGEHAISIQWGAWEQTGLHAGEGGEARSQDLQWQGINHFSPAEGAAAFANIARRSDACVSYSPVDWAALQRARRARFRALIRDRVPETGKPEEHQAAARIASASPADRRLLVEGIVRAAVGRVLRIAPQRIDRRKPFGSMGLTSLMALELRNRLEAQLERSFSATLAWNYPTVDALVGYIAGEATPAVVVAPTATAVPSGMAAMSDEDAARALRRRR